ncbi:hypothetical protein PULV_a4255 [Pseudoalteromonas ulvae UL12]|nr:hypothetical protein [Pseudoalteromonas ulvae UL12]
MAHFTEYLQVLVDAPQINSGNFDLEPNFRVQNYNKGQ